MSDDTSVLTYASFESHYVHGNGFEANIIVGCFSRARSNFIFKPIDHGAYLTKLHLLVCLLALTNLDGSISKGYCQTGCEDMFKRFNENL